MSTEAVVSRGGAHLTQGNAVADVNQDGHLDVLVVNMAGNFNLYGTKQLLINDGTGNFSVSQLPSGSLYSSSVATVDIDNGNCDHWKLWGGSKESIAG